MENMTPITVLLIDDHALFRRGLRQLIDGDSAFLVTGEAGSGTEGIAIALATQPDLILLDLNMKDMDGVQTLKKLKEAECTSRCVMLTVSDDKDDLVLALREGADGYLLKDMEPEELSAQLKKVVMGMTVVQDSLTETLKNAILHPGGLQANQQAMFTEREKEVLGCIADGMNNKTISNHLGITVTTVKVHIKNILRKLNLTSRLEAAVWAHQQKTAKNP